MQFADAQLVFFEPVLRVFPALKLRRGTSHRVSVEAGGLELPD
jgi:hypothetical protein